MKFAPDGRKNRDGSERSEESFNACKCNVLKIPLKATFMSPARDDISWVYQQFLTVPYLFAFWLEVLEYRLKNEYNVEIRIRTLPFTVARWVISAEKFTKENIGYYDAVVVEDQYERPVVLANNQWTLNYILDKNKLVSFLDIAPPVEE